MNLRRRGASACQRGQGRGEEPLGLKHRPPREESRPAQGPPASDRNRQIDRGGPQRSRTRTTLAGPDAKPRVPVCVCVPCTAGVEEGRRTVAWFGRRRVPWKDGAGHPQPVPWRCVRHARPLRKPADFLGKHRRRVSPLPSVQRPREPGHSTCGRVPVEGRRIPAGFRPEKRRLPAPPTVSRDLRTRSRTEI